MIDKTEQVNLLFDIYGSLLTKKQQEIMSLYYREDLSLREIAEECEISHAAVGDHLKRGTAILENYESHLKIVEKYEKRMRVYDKIAMLEDDRIQSYLEELRKTEQ